MTMDSTTLAALLGAVKPQEPNITGLPATTFPTQPMALNPQFMQMILQAMQGTNQQAPQATLGQLLSGR